MDRRQRRFLIIISAVVGLFVLILIILKLSQNQAVPAPVTPVVPGPTQPARTLTPNPSKSNTPESTSIIPNTAPKTGTPTTQGTPTTAVARDFYVSPDGTTTGDGSKAQPWALQFVLDGKSAAQPGDTVWLVGGKYIGPFTSWLKGAEGKPITIRAMPGERVTLTSDDLVLDIASSYYVNFWGLEITALVNDRSKTDPNVSAYGVRINQGKPSHDIKFINMIVHDMPAQGFGWWQANTDSEIYGTLIYNNGSNQFQHGIYVHNTEGKKSIIDNIIFDNASHGIHAYGEKEGQLYNNLLIEGNTLFDNGSIGFTERKGVYGIFKRNILVGGPFIAENPVIKNNYTYYPGAVGEALNLGYRTGSKDAIVEDNYFAGGSVAISGETTGISMLKNTILGFSLAALPNIADSENTYFLFKQDSQRIFVRPNQYESGRANVTIYNWTHKPTVTLTSADLKDVQIKSGDQYELHNVQNYFDDVITGTYNGESIDIPMTNHSVAQPLGLGFKPPSTFPEFGAFVLFVKPAN